MSDYYQDLKTEFEALSHNRMRMHNESKWWESVMEGVSAWERETNTDVYVTSFKTETRWRPEALVRSQYQSWVNGNPVIFQWTLLNGTDLELAVRRLIPKPADNLATRNYKENMRLQDPSSETQVYA